MKRRYHLHYQGLLYVFVTLLVAFSAVNLQNNLLFWILGVLISALLISGVVSGVMMSRLQIKRLIPSHGLVGDALPVRYALTNRGRLMPAFNLHIEECPAVDRLGWNHFLHPGRAWVMHAGLRETVHGEAIFWPHRRGRVTFKDLRIWTTFPFGIVKKSITVSTEKQTLVYPELFELRRAVLSRLTRHGLLGVRITRRSGAGDDYFGMREYRPGDSMRQIAWKRTAALDRLISIERTQPAPPKLRIILNLARGDEAGDAQHDASSQRELEEKAISLAASIIFAANQLGYELGLTVLGIEGLRFAIRRHHWHTEKLFAGLAGIDLQGERQPLDPEAVPSSDHAGQIVIHVDSVYPSVGQPDGLHLSARQFDNLVLRPLGWASASRGETGTKNAEARAGAPAPHNDRSEAAA